MNILFVGGGVVAAVLLIVAAKKSYGPFMAGIQGIVAFVLILNGALSASEDPLPFGIGSTLFVLISGYYFVPKLLWEFRVDSKNKTLQGDSDFNLIFGRKLDETEEKIVRLWISTFGTSLYDSKKIKVAPYVNESLFDDADKKLFCLPKDESILFHYETLATFFVMMFRAAGKQGVVITTKGVYCGNAKWFLGAARSDGEENKYQIYYKDIKLSGARIVTEKGWASFPRIVLDEAFGFNFQELAGSSKEGSEEFLKLVLDFIKQAARKQLESKVFESLSGLRTTATSKAPLSPARTETTTTTNNTNEVYLTKTIDVTPNLANCQSCNTKGVLPMKGNICPNCKKPLV